MTLDQHIYLFLRKIARQERIIGTVAVASLIVLVYFLPNTPVLSSFGRPEHDWQVDTPAEVLGYLQRYNDAIARTTEVLRYTLMGLALAFGTLVVRLGRETESWSRTSDVILKVRRKPGQAGLTETQLENRI